MARRDASTPGGTCGKRTGEALIEALLAAWPSLPCMAFGLVSCWVALSCSGSTWLSLGAETNTDNLTVMLVATGVLEAVVMVCAALLAGKTKAVTFFESKRTVLGAGLVCSLASLVIIAIGPYYLGPALDALTPEAPRLASLLVFWFCAALIGAGLGLILLRCSALFGALAPRRAILNVAMSELLAAAVYFGVVACSAWEPVAGGPSGAGIIAFVVLPLLAAVMACLVPIPGLGDKAEQDGRGGGETKRRPGFTGARRLPGSFWRLAALSFILAFGTSALRASVAASHELASSQEGAIVLILLRVALACAFVFVALRIASQDSVSLGRIMSLAGVVAGSIIAAAAALGGLTGFWSELVYFAGVLFGLVFWCLLALIVKQKGISPLIVFGWGRGLYVLGDALGCALGGWVLPGVVSHSTVIDVTIAVVMVVASLILFGERDYERLFSPIDESELSLSDLFGIDTASDAGCDDKAGSEHAAHFRRAIAWRADQGCLSARETDVFRLLAMGYGSDRIASELGVAVNTVRVHTHNVYVKLGVHSRDELMTLADRDVAHLDQLD